MIVQLVKMVIAITIGLIVYSAAPYVEGYFFPVITNVRIDDIQPVGDYTSRMSITFDKIRECNFIQLQAFYGKPWDDFVAVDSDLVNEPNPPDRPVGTYTVLLDIELLPTQIYGQTFIKLTYSCHTPWLWNTVWMDTFKT